MVEEIPWLYQLCLMVLDVLRVSAYLSSVHSPVTMLSVYMLLYSQRLELPSTKIPLLTDTSITLVMKR